MSQSEHGYNNFQALNGCMFSDLFYSTSLPPDPFFFIRFPSLATLDFYFWAAFFFSVLPLANLFDLAYLTVS